MNLGSCASWLCSKKEEEKTVPNHNASEYHSVVTSGPGPSPASSSSCDDVIPPSKNCYRLVVLGSARVGKTCLVSRFLGGKFHDSYTPTIEDFHRKLYRIRGEIYQLDILDTSGNHPFPAMRRLSFLTGDLFVIVFSMDSRETFEEAIRLREQIIETKVNAGTSSNASGLTRKKIQPRIPMIFAGNKNDKEMKTVSVDEAQAYCDTQDSCCAFVETSAKKNHQVDEVFYRLFSVANLPQEMAPNHHKRVSASFGAPCPLPPSTPSHYSKKYHLSVKRRLSDACGVVTPNVRRPSIRTDLMIMRTKAYNLGDGGGTNSSPLQWRRANGDRACVLQ
ncbi:GTP-binding protein Rhes [Cylas formicarius]|uniref:GTP-binding protein Rhes n=1 Tax=Cylas formicarius TaxID=197179 RepID=UPI0029586526|nr:GTP-binding protein Rhes [Cylas formicarius]